MFELPDILTQKPSGARSGKSLESTEEKEAFLAVKNTLLDGKFSAIRSKHVEDLQKQRMILITHHEVRSRPFLVNQLQ